MRDDVGRCKRSGLMHHLASDFGAEAIRRHGQGGCIWHVEHPLYCGAFLFFIYGRAFPRLLPTLTAKGLPHPQQKANIVKMVLIDNFIMTPCFFMPSYYLIKSALEGGFESFRSPGVTAKHAWQRYSVEWFDACKVVWACWIPIHLVTFSIMPVHWRVPFTSAMSLFTMMLNSLQQSNLEGKRAQLKDEP
ncbi:unnamed protein product [Polarella glacialis]|uniref:Uncharacterized protein n=1 Tax=Polarella glacialis TaxID=89957 RepID=A0A813J7U0_POLGL|nr:unnamed protein product [Polarella glacialis]CAE8672407.1 unnamed protein product [Polarella glacialis]